MSEKANTIRFAPGATEQIIRAGLVAAGFLVSDLANKGHFRLMRSRHGGEGQVLVVELPEVPECPGTGTSGVEK